MSTEIKMTKREIKSIVDAKFRRLEQKVHHFLGAQMFARENNDTELEALLKDRLDKIELEKVSLTIELMDDTAMYALCSLYNCNKDGLVEILGRKLEQEEQKTKEVQKLVDESKVKVQDKTEQSDSKEYMQLLGIKNVKEFVANDVLKSRDTEGFMENGKFVKQKYYDHVAKAMGCKPDNVRMTVNRHYKEQFNNWISC